MRRLLRGRVLGHTTWRPDERLWGICSHNCRNVDRQKRGINWEWANQGSGWDPASKLKREQCQPTCISTVNKARAQANNKLNYIKNTSVVSFSWRSVTEVHPRSQTRDCALSRCHGEALDIGHWHWALGVGRLIFEEKSGKARKVL